ncbi:uncharacterized protein BYT42DRAFT_562233 [Radiomyces spectabilis]|uniref:uncharacterized protein n=1 Tax=Radiomyces spectabilis TaxID=64574 RepID=UPI0022208EC6|nr:uncharacterized protein BYT42DRAFT_562233 [Radiomyces spectabilis]KAI8384359.1 hypothetical protein BYT42DRAFT_562233 [Radiomyces spectabilis]
MKFTFLLVSACLMLSAAALPTIDQACHQLTEVHAQAVCQEHCGNHGFKLGECGLTGICICDD